LNSAAERETQFAILLADKCLKSIDLAAYIDGAGDGKHHMH